MIIYLVGLLLVSSCNLSPKKNFKLSPKEALAQANNQENVISPQLLADIYYTQGSEQNFRFIDLRPPNVFENGHVEGAINIPFQTMTKGDNCRPFFADDLINIIYGSSPEQVIFAGFMLKQIGVNNYFIVLGDYGFIRDNIIENYNVYSAPYNPEIALYDYAHIVAETAGAQGQSLSNQVSKPAIRIQRRKKEAAGGGCD